MIITSLKLSNFRNYDGISVNFNKGLNFIYGENSSGKTNLVEAIYYLSLARSFRTNTNLDMIKSGCEYATIEAIIEKGENQKKKIHSVVMKNSRNLSVNGKEIKKLSELTDIANVLIFEPRDVNLFKENPKARRNYLDTHLSKMSHLYLQSMSMYNKLLSERNEVLKKEKIDKVLLQTIEEMMMEVSFKIYQMRSKFLNHLEIIVNKVLKSISSKNRIVCLKYQHIVEGETKEQYQECFKTAFKKALESDLRYKTTTIGVHREDFLTALNNQNIVSFGSQGEKRMVALALKIAPYFLIQKQEERPIVVLDDVLSELDDEHVMRLLNFFEKFEQVFITGTKIVKCSASYYEVANQNITRRTNYGR